MSPKYFSHENDVLKLNSTVESSPSPSFEVNNAGEVKLRHRCLRHANFQHIHHTCLENLSTGLPELKTQWSHLLRIGDEETTRNSQDNKVQSSLVHCNLFMQTCVGCSLHLLYLTLVTFLPICWGPHKFLVVMENEFRNKSPVLVEIVVASTSQRTSANTYCKFTRNKQPGSLDKMGSWRKLFSRPPKSMAAQSLSRACLRKVLYAHLTTK